MTPYTLLGLLLAVVLVSASDVPEVKKQEFQQNIVDIYIPNSRVGFRRQWLSALYQRPVILLAPKENISGEKEEVVAFYADNGLRSVVDYKNFEPLFQLLRLSKHNYGLVLNDQVLRDNSLGLNNVQHFVLPENFRLFDLLRENVDNVPVVYLAPKEVFNSHHFVNIELAARFVLDEYNLDPVPSVTFDPPEKPTTPSDNSGRPDISPVRPYPGGVNLPRPFYPPFRPSLPNINYPSQNVHPSASQYPIYFLPYGSFPYNSNGMNNFNVRNPSQNVHPLASQDPIYFLPYGRFLYNALNNGMNSNYNGMNNFNTRNPLQGFNQQNFNPYTLNQYPIPRSYNPYRNLFSF